MCLKKDDLDIDIELYAYNCPDKLLQIYQNHLASARTTVSLRLICSPAPLSACLLYS